MPPRNALSRRIRKAGAAVRAGLFLVLALIALTLAAPTSAAADFACDFTGDESYHRDSSGSNGESFIPAVRQWEDADDESEWLDRADDEKDKPQGLLTRSNTVSDSFKVAETDAERYTLYELNGMRGLNWSMTFKGKGDASEDNGDVGSGADDCEVMAYVNNGIANSIFYGTKVLTRFSISVKELASNPSPFAGLYSGRDSAVTTLKEGVLIPAVPVMIVLVGLWVFTKWRNGDMREVWAGISWTTLTTIAVMAFLAGTNYDKFVAGADKWIAQANSTLASTVLSGVSGTPQSPCDLKDKRGQVGLRLSSCAMYDTLAFRPWALGQFGDVGNNCIFKINDGGSIAGNGSCRFKGRVDNCYWGAKDEPRCADLRVRQAVAQSSTNVEKKVDQFVAWQDIRKDIAVSEDAADKSIYPVAFDDWTGKNATDRVGIAFYSLVAAFIVGVMVLVLSALTLLWHAVTLILIILLPLIATLGIHPSQQKLLKGWLETFVHSFVLRAGFGVILTVLLVLYQMILPAQIALGTQLLMLVLVTTAVVMMLKKLLAGNFSPEFAGGGGDALGIREAASAGSDKVVAKGETAMANAPKVTGRVAGTAAKGTAWAVDRAIFKGKGRGKMQEKGWLGQSKREQNQSAYWAKEDARAARADRAAARAGNNSNTPAPRPEQEPEQEPEVQDSAGSRRSGRVSGSSGAQTQQPSPKPAPSPAPTAPAPRQEPEPQSAPRRVAPADPTPPTPRPAPRDPRDPSGRV